MTEGDKRNCFYLCKAMIRPHLEQCIYRLGGHDLWNDIDKLDKRQMKATKLIPGPSSAAAKQDDCALFEKSMKCLT